MRKASVRWIGGAGNGSGTMCSESGALKQVQFSTSFPFKKSKDANPEEFVAAAHAASFSLALARELGAAGFTPDHICVIAIVTLENQAALWRISGISLDVLARVPEAAQGDFIDASLKAKSSCLISQLLRVNVSMNAKLESNAEAGPTNAVALEGGRRNPGPSKKAM